MQQSKVARTNLGYSQKKTNKISQSQSFLLIIEKASIPMLKQRHAGQ